MEFWGVEVKAGESLKVQPEFGKAALGEVKDLKRARRVPIRMAIDANKYVMGTLSAEDRPQLMFDLVFEREFELSHDWKSGSVYFIGYMAEFDHDQEYPIQNGGIRQLKVEDVKPTKDKATAAETGIQKEEASESDDDVIQTTNTSPSKDPLIVEQGPMTRLRAKKVKEETDKITSKRSHA